MPTLAHPSYHLGLGSILDHLGIGSMLGGANNKVEKIRKTPETICCLAKGKVTPP